MPAPIVYHGNLFLSGTVFQFGRIGSAEDKFLVDPDNSYLRQVDGSTLLPYATSGVNYFGTAHSTILVSLASAGYNPLACFIDRKNYTARSVLNPAFRAVSDDDGNSPTTTLLNLDWSAGVSDGLFVADLVAFDATKTFYLMWQRSTIAGSPTPEIYEIGLTNKWTMPRSPEVGIARERVRQVTRIPVQGGQPFVKRDGPILRRTTYQAVMLSGTEISAFNSFIADVQGGEIFPFTDDLGDTYWAELMNPEVATADEAGVYRATLIFQEVRKEID